jgi:ferrochelatase
MGGPDGPRAVAPFLRNLFADPAVLPLPRWLSGVVGLLIVRRRLKGVQERYRLVGYGGGSPQLRWTRRQADRLAELIAARGCDAVPACAMRYWHPFASETASELLAHEVAQILVVPTYPQYASATSGSSLADFCTAAVRLAPHLPLHVVSEWHLLPSYIAALAVRAAKPLNDWADQGVPARECALVYAAHSLPERFVRGGDPYVEQTRATVAAVQSALGRRLAGRTSWLADVAGGSTPLLAYQSKVGPVRWVGPDVFDVASKLVRGGRTRLALVPVSFTCEHIETLVELDQELGDELRRAGVVEYVRAPALNLDEGWLAGFADHLHAAAFGAPATARGAAPGDRT